ncbi:hypothetical protein EYC80_003538 [Monilinia laxa]|uniref:Peptidase S8/S53 domain-containing protein n=1 Tax=Monilinia laxa TaxID=61186 RepID=A0A5N6KKB7_MONLA|nr:hypothetical protein EYC80_003538 [Monilinia laxa]
MQSLKGFLFNTTSPSLISEILQDPNIAYIEPNTLFSISTLTTQRQSPYGLARLSHRSAKSDGSYIYDSSSGSGVTVYIIDTGIYTQHSEFETRATFGANFVPGSPDTDENGHGTHCAGTVGGKTYGVAKAARLVGVKVLDRDGSGSNSGIIEGIQWVTRNAPRNSVISMSLGGGYSRATNSAVKSAVDAGITVVVAAGNDNSDARNHSPASEPDAVTAGATDSNDNRASFSNYGPVLDIFAPGVNVLSAWIGGANSSKSISGTSMATPHIAGLSAYLISLEKLSTPSAVITRLKNLATKDVVRNAAGSLNLVSLSPDLYIPTPQANLNANTPIPSSPTTETEHKLPLLGP